MKKLIALLLALAMIFSLAASDTPAEDKPAEDKPASTEPIIVGGFLSLTGSSAAGGNAAYNGAMVAVNYVNENGGINGRPIELLMYDDASTPEGAVKAVNRLIEQDEVSVILGSHLSPNMLAAIPYLDEAGVPCVGLGTGLNWTKCGSEFAFRGTMSGYSLYPTMIEQLKETGDNNVAFFYAENDLGQAARTWFMEGGFQDAGINVVSEVSYQKAESDFTGHIAKALAANPEAIVIIAAAGTETAQFIKQLRQQGFTGLVYGVENSSASIITETAGDLANGLVFAAAALNTPTPEEALSEETGMIMQLYLDTYGEVVPNDAPFRSWDAIMIIAEALKNVDDVDDPQAIRDAIVAITDYDGVQGHFDFSAADGDGLNAVNKFVIMDQKLKVFDAEEVKAWRDAQG